MSKIVELWRGNVSLPKTGWGYGLLITVVLAGITHLIAIFGLASALPVFTKLIALALLIHSPFIAVAIWRSANKYKGPIIWRWFAHGSILFVVGIVAAGLLGYLPSIKDLTSLNNML